MFKKISFRYLVVYLFSPLLFANTTAWMDFELASDHVKIPVVIAGIEGYAILDTGAQINSINTAFIKKHKLKFDHGKEINVKGVYDTQRRLTYNNVLTNYLVLSLF